MAFAGFGHIALTLRQHDFRIYIIGQAFAQSAVWMQRLTTGWLAWELTGSTTWLGLIAMADFIPTMSVGAISGVLADRFNRLTIIRVTQAMLGLAAAALFVLVEWEWITIELLFVFVLVMGTALSVNLPARLAIVPVLAGRENLHAGVALNSLISNSGRFIGPAIAGLVIAQWGTAPAFAICALFFGIPAVALMLIEHRPEKPEASGKRIWGDMIDGLSYTVRHPGIGPLMASLTVTSTLGKAITVLFPAFAADIFNRGAPGVAWLTAMMGAGAVLGGIYMAQRPGVTGLTRIFIINIGLTGGGLAAFAATGQFWVAVGIIAALGWSQIVNGVSAQTLMQHGCEQRMSGRVASLYVMIQRGGQSLGGLILGVAADLFGLSWTVIAGGCVCLLFCLWSLRRLDAMTRTLEN